MPDNFYTDKLYPFQDAVLKSVKTAGVDFYLTGGTALSRAYLRHRYSDDLDFFLNDASDFKKQVEKTVSRFRTDGIEFEIGATSDSFIRLNSERDGIPLKIDFVNDIPFHYGKIEFHDILGKIDNWRNILSNKICALSRLEAKDVADILFIAIRYPFNWEEIINESKEKDLWVEPLDVSKLIGSFPVKLLKPIKWIHPISDIDVDQNLAQMQADIFFGKDNSLPKS
jgi:Nucleotidyl transferase AbiEii toxin, Type IV TA system